jgi:DNA polymerase-3 subunit chi
MTTIQFYHLRSTSRERAVPKLMEKALESGAKVLVLAAHQATLKTISDAMWINDPNAFIPHGFAREGNADQQPILLTLVDENPNQASILCLLDGAAPADFSAYQKILDVFDGNNDEEVAAARIRWSRLKEQGHALQYVKQQPGGGWKIEMSVEANQ